MPYRRLPKSDTQRLIALSVAKFKADNTDPAKLLFSAATLARIDGFLPNFAAQMQERSSALGVQSAATVIVSDQRQKLRMYCSHFIQVFDLGVDRGLHPASARAYYSLPISSSALPDMGTEEEIRLVAEAIVAGEAERVADGGIPMANPSAAEVDAVTGEFDTAKADQTTKKDTYDSEQEDVEALREEADDIILDIWDEVEFNLRKEEPSSMRRKAREYGVVYVPRSDEVPEPGEFSLTGTVTDSETGSPLMDVEVEIPDLGTTVVTDTEGKYFFGSLPGGSHDIQFSREGYQTLVRSVMITEDEVAELDVALVPEGGEV